MNNLNLCFDQILTYCDYDECLNSEEGKNVEDFEKESNTNPFTNNLHEEEDSFSFNLNDQIKNDNKANNDIDLFYKNKICIEKIKKLLQEIGISTNIIELIKNEYLSKIDLDNVNLFGMIKKSKKKIIIDEGNIIIRKKEKVKSIFV